MNRSLSDIRVLEIGQVLAAPFAGMLLGDLGAEVLKIEGPSGGDSARRTPPHFFGGESIYFMSLNRNKKSIVLDLTSEEGLLAFYGLVQKSDVVLDNLRCGVHQKLKIDYETLHALNPRLVVCSINGYGSDTPDRLKPSFDLMVQARGGGMSLTGEPGGAPVRMGVSVSDHVAGIYAVTGILAALHERERTGAGRRIEVPLLSTMLSLLSYEAALHLYSGEIPGPVGSGHRSLVPYSAVRTADGNMVVDAHLPKFWSALCLALNVESLENDPRFHTLEARGRNRTELMEILGREFACKPTAEWIEILEARGVPCAPINDLKGALEDPAASALGMVAEIEHTGVGLTFKTTGNPIRMHGAEGGPYGSPPLLGEHTRDVLKSLLGYSDAAVDKLLGGEKPPKP